MYTVIFLTSHGVVTDVPVEINENANLSSSEAHLQLVEAA